MGKVGVNGKKRYEIYILQDYQPAWDQVCETCPHAREVVLEAIKEAQAGNPVVIDFKNLEAWPLEKYLERQESGKKNGKKKSGKGKKGGKA